MKKTNAVRILDRHKIKYKLIPYTYDIEDLSATKLAKANGFDIDKLYKTLVAVGDKNGPLVAVIPGASTLNLKAIAKASGNKKVALLPMKELQSLTGYIRGGCTSLGMKKDFPTFIDEKAFEHETILISAGVRGTQIELQATDLEKVTRATVVSISEI